MVTSQTLSISQTLGTSQTRITSQTLGIYQTLDTSQTLGKSQTLYVANDEYLSNKFRPSRYTNLHDSEGVYSCNAALDSLPASDYGRLNKSAACA
jgi:hypothetical protein